MGGGKKLYYRRLQKKYEFDPWATSPYELRDYLQLATEYINSHGPFEHDIVDIGCSLGELLRRIPTGSRLGLDYDKGALACARMLDKSGKIRFEYGSFAEYGKGHTADFLITLGFTHGGTEETWYGPYHTITADNDIRNIVVDVFPQGADGANHLDFTKILPENYRLAKRYGPLNGDKYLEIYTKTE